MALVARAGWGAVAVRREVERVGDAVEAWQRWAREHPEAGTIARDRAETWREKTRQLGAQILTLGDPRYPPLLAQTSDPPPVLYALGTVPEEGSWGRALAVVGTRSCTKQGAAWAKRIGSEWTEAGGRLVSGLARGIDGRAHAGAMEGTRSGAQVAVLPCSLESIHPRMHGPLAQRIVDSGGVLVSEQPPGAQVERWMFAARNRILTGLAPSTVVVQSPARGGSLISARCAFDQNRDVFTFWRGDMRPAWAGNRALVADDLARPVRDVDGLWRALADAARDRALGAAPGSSAPNPAGVPEGCRDVWRALSETRPVSWLQLKLRLGLPNAALDRQLFTLEVQGWIRRLPGRAYLRA
jgi:DNA processing protein